MSLEADMHLDHLEDLTKRLRALGVTAWDGWVPGWPKDTSAKFLLQPEPATARNPEEPASRPPARPKPLTDDELDAAALKHVRIHSAPPEPPKGS